MKNAIDYNAQRQAMNSSYTMRELDGGLVVFVNVGAHGRPIAKGYRGKAMKPAWFYSFKSDAAMESHIATWAAGQQKVAEFNAEQKSKRTAPHSLVVGDILHTSWGYDQTNNDYFQVTALIGARMIEVREIGASYKEQGYMCGHSTPIAGSFKGVPMRKMVNGNRIKVASYATAGKWSGSPNYESSYA